MLVPQLRAELEVKTPADRGPGRAWERGPAIDATVPQATTKPTRVGYARCSTAQQELQSQLDALAEAGCDPVFAEKIRPAPPRHRGRTPHRPPPRGL
ncbi:recombinase family protein [Streptomyces sp. NBC_01353]